ncbi:hypothetical protein M434DRAFT_221079 [Hypoxylon sp. CO27-5]|nr:hypothetical protein M434DRAFT_221079 [Hypoxylon sp. CO27-5]
MINYPSGTATRSRLLQIKFHNRQQEAQCGKAHDAAFSSRTFMLWPHSLLMPERIS